MRDAHNLPFQDLNSFKAWRHSEKSDEEVFAALVESENRWVEAQRYNGWEGEQNNRISARWTWHLSLVMEPDGDDFILEYVKENFEKDELYRIGDWLKGYYEEIVYVDSTSGRDLRSKLHPAADAAISDMVDWVNWPLIAEHVVDAIDWDVKKEVEEEDNDEVSED